jgi:microsomal epoxide hydrolase
MRALSYYVQFLHRHIIAQVVNVFVAYWERTYDWESQEAWLNQFNQYRMKTSKGTWIHFIHLQSDRQRALPLVLLHGYTFLSSTLLFAFFFPPISCFTILGLTLGRFPSTVVEYFKVIRALAEPEDESDPAFHLVCVSMPGCGFSDSLGPGVDTAEIAAMVAELMSSMDYMIYAAHGSGIGGVVAAQLGSLFPSSCVAVHTGTPIPDLKSMSESVWERMKSSVRFTFPSAFFSEDEVRQINNFRIRDYWDNMSVDLKWSYAVSSDPLALAAFFHQKLRNTTDCKGKIENVFSKDELITFISIYWFSRNINSAIHLYHNNSVNLFRTSYPFSPVEVPVGVAIYPAQQTLPKQFSTSLYRNVTDWKYMKRGGYFPAWEDPNAFVEGIRVFFSSLCEA